jgi:ferrous-iron efflux pump FieF
VNDKTALIESGDNRMRRLATYASVGVSSTLIFCKLAAFFYTNSVAMLSSLLDSTIDLIAALVTVYGVASALRPPDREHRFGHGKAEPLAALAQAAFIVGSSVLLGYEALSRFYNPHEIANENFGYAVMILAIVLSVALVTFQHLVVRRTGSMAIGADRLHYMGDVGINLAVIAAFGLYQWTGLSWFDPAFAILIAAALAYNAFRIAIAALHVLMDHELPDADREKIKSIVQAEKNVRGIHDLRTRFDGERAFIEFHLELDENMTLKVAQAIAEKIMSAIRKQFPDADIFIHQDPAGLQETRLDQQIEVGAARE